MTRTELRCHLALILAMILWGSSFIALKLALLELPAMQVIFLRMVIGSAGFLLIWPRLRRGFRYRAGDWPLLLGMALFEPCIYFVLEGNGLRFTSAGQAGMITAMLPLMVAIAAWFFINERVSLRQWLGFGIAVTGVFGMTMAGESNDQAPQPLLGNTLQFFAMVSATGYTLLAKQLITRYSAVSLTAFQCFVGVVFFLPLAVLAERPTEISATGIAILLYLGLAITLGTYGLYNYSLGHLRASVAAGYTNLLPVFALLFSVLLLGERLSAGQWASIAVIFVGVVLSQYHSKAISVELPPAATG